VRGGSSELLATMGMHGVDLFFVISGFCLSYPYLSGARFDWRAFAAKRAWRIIPPYYAALAFLFVFVPWAGELENGGTSARDLLAQLTFWDGSGRHFLSSVFWSLCVEMRWYVAFPFILWLFVRSKWAVGGLALSCYVLYALTETDVRDVVGLPAFMAGIGVAFIYVRRLDLARRAAFFALCVLPVAYFGSRYIANPESVLLWAAVAVVASCYRPLQAALSWHPLKFIGNASYSIYLVHDPMILWAAKNGIIPAFAGLFGVGAGVVFWYCVERTLTRANFDALCVRARRAVSVNATPYRGAAQIRGSIPGDELASSADAQVSQVPG
jgi:peptidoglycan/LPS O-acetylase OafA/YrhL